MKKFYILLLLLLNNHPIFGQCAMQGVNISNFPDCNQGVYYLIFEDNFNGNSIDLSKWREPENPGALYGTLGHGQEYMTFDNVEVNNGSCKIIAKEETVMHRAISYLPDAEILNDGIQNYRQFNYTSARLVSQETYWYGKYEIKCRMPAGNGLWPAFWTFGGTRWNEIDVFEIYGDDITRFTCNSHHDWDNDGNSESCSLTLDNYANFGDWHIFTCEFDFDKIIWYIDYVPVRIYYHFETVAGNPIECGDNVGNGTAFTYKNYPLERMNINISMAIQNAQSPTAPNSSTVFPSTFEVDWVKYYKKIVPTCPSDLTYEAMNYLPPESQTSNNINAQNGVAILNNQSVEFIAGNEINIGSEFMSDIGSEFFAHIEQCPILRIGNPDSSFDDSSYIINKQEHISDFALRIAPNIVQKGLNIVGELKQEQFFDIYITDTSGKLKYHEIKYLNNSNQNRMINLFNFDDGLYFIKLISSSTSFNEKFIVIN